MFLSSTRIAWSILVCSLLLCISCGGDGGEESMGGDGERCYGNSTCDSGLICDSDNICVVDSSDPCDGVTCSGNGFCAVSDGEAVCVCDDGFHDDGLDCIADEDDLCAGIECDGYGDCFVSGGIANCVCDPGYYDEGLRCIEDSSPCDGEDCSDHGDCVVRGDRATCDCDEGYEEDGLSCVEVDLCDGETCSGHGDCVVRSGRATCDCDEGYEENGLRCIEEGADPCDGENCSSHGDCIVRSGGAVCDCDEGYEAEGLRCIEIDLCEGERCSGHGDCVVRSGRATCDCDGGYHSEGLDCVEDDVPEHPVISIDRRIMRHDGPVNHVLLIEDSNIVGSFAPDEVFTAEISWSLPGEENMSAIWRGAVIGDWNPTVRIAEIHSGRTPRIGETQEETFSVRLPSEPGWYTIRFILNAGFTMPARISDFTHYRYDFIVQVCDGGECHAVPEHDYWMVLRNGGSVEHHLAIVSENLIGRTLSRGSAQTLSFSWQIPHEENFSAVYRCNAFGSWAQDVQLASFHAGMTPSRGETQRETISFTSPGTAGIYSLRLICNAAFSYAGSFTGDTHYFFDMVFNVR